MTAALPPSPQPPLGRLKQPSTIDDVLRNIDQIISWSMKAKSGIGYFAVLYRRVTLAIREAINEGKFDDGRRMQDLDVAFAQRYFDALNAYFYRGHYQGLTLPWEVAFVGDQDGQAIIVQHMMAGLNAHITFDLGHALVKVAPRSLEALKNDYSRVNDLLCLQIPDIVKVVERLSPDLRWTRWLMPYQVRLLQRALTKLREGAWLFAIYMAMNPLSAPEKSLHQQAWTAALSSWYLHPPERWTPFPRIISAVARHESTDVAGNIRTLEEISQRPKKIK